MNSIHRIKRFIFISIQKRKEQQQLYTTPFKSEDPTKKTFINSLNKKYLLNEHNPHREMEYPCRTPQLVFGPETKLNKRDPQMGLENTQVF